ncbi:hypothetical protein NNG48_07080 [Enterococcus faecium]|nr:hypothetical protein [Enterococcus faecium]
MTAKTKLFTTSKEEMKMGKLLNGLAIGGGIVVVLGAGFFVGAGFMSNQPDPEPQTVETTEPKVTEPKVVPKEPMEEKDPYNNIIEEAEDKRDEVLRKALNTDAEAPTTFTYNPALMNYNNHVVTNGVAYCVGYIQVTAVPDDVPVELQTECVDTEFTCNVCHTQWWGNNYKWENKIDECGEWCGYPTATQWHIVGTQCEHAQALQNNGYIK